MSEKQECAYLATCPFFNDTMSNMPSMANLLKDKYCREQWNDCARYMVASAVGPEKVPSNLFPNQQEHAHEFMGGSKLSQAGQSA